MKKKDIIILVVASIVIAGSVFFLLRLLNPPVENQNTKTESESIKAIPTTFDENTLKRIQSLSDYGNPGLENIGKADLFAGY
jgi:hypothetical protein